MQKVPNDKADLSVALAPQRQSWQVLDPQAMHNELSAPLSAKRARLWSLVLEARGLPCRLQRTGRQWQLLVPADSLSQAVDELQRYEEENRHWPPPLAPPVPLQGNSLVTLSVLALLGLFHNLTYLTGPSFDLGRSDWLQFGNAAAGAILSGQWWRAVTALTLHADGLHLLGNLLIGGFFIDRLNREVGAGRGWALVLAAGTLGNLANALLQPIEHRAVGLSTAVFGAVAILAVRSLRHHRQALRRRWPLPLAAALALLGLLGSGGPTTDIGAHLWGFVLGLGLGWLSSLCWPPQPTVGRMSNLLAGLASTALVIGAWLAALLRA